jgi:hypothetical protein
MNKETCIGILRRRKGCDQKETPTTKKKQRTNGCFLRHENAPAHRSVLVETF